MQPKESVEPTYPEICDLLFWVFLPVVYLKKTLTKKNLQTALFVSLYMYFRPKLKQQVQFESFKRNKMKKLIFIQNC